MPAAVAAEPSATAWAVEGMTTVRTFFNDGGNDRCEILVDIHNQRRQAGLIVAFSGGDAEDAGRRIDKRAACGKRSLLAR